MRVQEIAVLGDPLEVRDVLEILRESRCRGIFRSWDVDDFAIGSLEMMMSLDLTMDCSAQPPLMSEMAVRSVMMTIPVIRRVMGCGSSWMVPSVLDEGLPVSFAVRLSRPRCVWTSWPAMKGWQDIGR